MIKVCVEWLVIVSDVGYGLLFDVEWWFFVEEVCDVVVNCLMFEVVIVEYEVELVVWCYWFCIVVVEFCGYGVCIWFCVLLG